MGDTVRTTTARRKRPAAGDLTARRPASVKGGIVTDNKDPDRLIVGREPAVSRPAGGS
jgi:hypothetical protein